MATSSAPQSQKITYSSIAAQNQTPVQWFNQTYQQKVVQPKVATQAPAVQQFYQTYEQKVVTPQVQAVSTARPVVSSGSAISSGGYTAAGAPVPAPSPTPPPAPTPVPVSTAPVSSGAVSSSDKSGYFTVDNRDVPKPGSLEALMITQGLQDVAQYQQGRARTQAERDAASKRVEMYKSINTVEKPPSELITRNLNEKTLLGQVSNRLVGMQTDPAGYISSGFKPEYEVKGVKYYQEIGKQAGVGQAKDVVGGISSVLSGAGTSFFSGQTTTTKGIVLGGLTVGTVATAGAIPAVASLAGSGAIGAAAVGAGQGAIIGAGYEAIINRNATPQSIAVSGVSGAVFGLIPIKPIKGISPLIQAPIVGAGVGAGLGGAAGGISAGLSGESISAGVSKGIIVGAGAGAIMGLGSTVGASLTKGYSAPKSYVPEIIKPVKVSETGIFGGNRLKKVPIDRGLTAEDLPVTIPKGTRKETPRVVFEEGMAVFKGDFSNIAPKDYAKIGGTRNDLNIPKVDITSRSNRQIQEQKQTTDFWESMTKPKETSKQKSQIQYGNKQVQEQLQKTRDQDAKMWKDLQKGLEASTGSKSSIGAKDGTIETGKTDSKQLVVDTSGTRDTPWYFNERVSTERITTERIVERETIREMQIPGLTGAVAATAIGGAATASVFGGAGSIFSGGGQTGVAPFAQIFQGGKANTRYTPSLAGLLGVKGGGEYSLGIRPVIGMSGVPRVRLTKRKPRKRSKRRKR